jgi:hypothetical protein
MRVRTLFLLLRSRSGGDRPRPVGAGVGVVGDQKSWATAQKSWVLCSVSGRPDALTDLHAHALLMLLQATCSSPLADSVN